jgi:predicted RNA-binding Zn ribbon-like protein
VNFNSHQDAVVLRAAELVNATTSGLRRGRQYAAPTGPELIAAILATLPYRPHLDNVQAQKLAGRAARLRAVFESVGHGDLDAAATGVNGLLDELRPTPYLEKHDGEPWHLHFHGRDADVADGIAGPYALGLATVLGSEYADRLGVCSAPECDRVYVDVSRNGTRRFCSTACQNRVKAAAHRARIAS